LVRFSIFYGVSYEMQVCLATFTHGFSLFFLCSWIPLRSISPNKFFQKKKRKKRKPSFEVEGFKKASFSDKILPELSLGKDLWSIGYISKRNGMGGDFIRNPQGLNLLFCKPGTYLCFLFFIYFFWISNQLLFWNRMWFWYRSI
jgi:hypothetical protein